MQCSSIEEMSIKYLDGTLQKQEETEFNNHLRVCGSCLCKFHLIEANYCADLQLSTQIDLGSTIIHQIDTQRYAFSIVALLRQYSRPITICMMCIIFFTALAVFRAPIKHSILDPLGFLGQEIADRKIEPLDISYSNNKTIHVQCTHGTSQEHIFAGIKDPAILRITEQYNDKLREGNPRFSIQVDDGLIIQRRSCDGQGSYSIHYSMPEFDDIQAYLPYPLFMSKKLFYQSFIDKVFISSIEGNIEKDQQFYLKKSGGQPNYTFSIFINPLKDSDTSRSVPDILKEELTSFNQIESNTQNPFYNPNRPERYMLYDSDHHPYIATRQIVNKKAVKSFETIRKINGKYIRYVIVAEQSDFMGMNDSVFINDIEMIR